LQIWDNYKDNPPHQPTIGGRREYSKNQKSQSFDEKICYIIANWCGFIWWFTLFFVPLQPNGRLLKKYVLSLKIFA
jgi:hypothetical protein